jgi:hypothetical protein
MAETTGKQAPKAKTPKSVRVETGPIEADPVVELEGFTPEEVARLMRVRRKIAIGEYTDVTPEHRKLLFVQWLIEHDRLMS